MTNKNFFEIKDDKCEEGSKFLSRIHQTSENNLYLIGAGCSVNSKGRTMKSLWDILSGKEDNEGNLIVDENGTINKINNFQALKSDAGYSDGENLEELLTKIKISESYFKGTLNVADENKMKDFKAEIEKNLKEHCRKDIKINNTNSIHPEFIEKITNLRKLSLPRTKIFSLNYDTLFEQAGNDGGYTIIDGFSFSIPRTFNGNNFDLDIVKRNKNYLEKEDNFEKKVFHLYKLHGSINWEDKEGKITQFDGAEGKLIYPGSSKYEQSYEMPYFEMISRFQQELRKENVTLTIIGYSFSDNHINSMIIEAFKTNPSLNLIIVGNGLFQKKYEEGDDEKDGFIKKEGANGKEKSYFNKIIINSIDILNEGLKMDRVFLFNMYFEAFINLIPKNQIKTNEETMIELMDKFKKTTT